MNKPKLAILADIASLKITCEGFQKLMRIKKVTVVYCKFYSYVAKNKDFKLHCSQSYDAVLHCLPSPQSPGYPSDYRRYQSCQAPLTP